MKAMPFSKWKAPLVLALPLGARFQTRRMMREGIPCRYRPGEVCYVGVPHWRKKEILRQPIIYDEWTALTRCEGRALDVLWRMGADTLRKEGFRRMAGRYLPGWAATQWVRTESNAPQRLQDITEEDAEAELVEARAWANGNIWKHYQRDCYSCPTATESYRTLIEAIHGPGTWGTNPWVWPIECEIVGRPEATQ